MAEVDTSTDVAPVPDATPDTAAPSADVAPQPSFVPNASRPDVAPPPDLPSKS